MERLIYLRSTVGFNALKRHFPICTFHWTLSKENKQLQVFLVHLDQLKSHDLKHGKWIKRKNRLQLHLQTGLFTRTNKNQNTINLINSIERNNIAKSIPTPTGKLRVCVNMLTDVHINAKKIDYENITNLGVITGMKRKNTEWERRLKEWKTNY